ncbi:Cytokinesis protein 3 [Wickerhamomyces ciferrii]|uniref:Cytokinesis protein 3 n=1 Tax=Wickerhamomyces ciferrii (strain ATCC 14091 / BCRC 22168 / CBS 111 / JCM 3599 / NBRC 0793 / NRRL Y-1031 F-60-10) TaxID=1206466 RepID=K0KJI9_WICCF|nr:Cytokinesis protein 3 [Wickerhamomyces ciferrii]CCH42277.1 Cytokinesis protein 3 [Wickerhamomyces ciferrii]
MTVPNPPFRVKTIYSWSGVEEDDLGFIEGDTIEVDSLGDGNWWHGKLKRNKMTGNFPSNYVEVIKSDLQPFSPSTRDNSRAGTASLESSPTRVANSSMTAHQSPRSASKTASPFASPSAKASMMKNNGRNKPVPMINQEEDDDMQFSFQSSRNYYSPSAGIPNQYNPQSPYRHEIAQQQQPPYPTQVLPTSYSVPVGLEQPQQQQHIHQQRYNQRMPQTQSSTNLHHTPSPRRVQEYSSSSAAPPPPPPQHYVPVKSQSTQNLKSFDPFAPQNPYNANDYSNRKSVLLKQATQNKLRDSQNSEFIAPYDPESLNQSKSTASQSSNVFSYSNGSYFSNSSNSHNSSYALSDFSATSAGSFARHRYEDQLKQKENLQSSGSGNHLLVEEKKLKKPTGIFKKMFTAKDAPPLPVMDDLTRGVGEMNTEDKEINSWIELKVDLNRANSLGAKERQLREKRVRENEGYIIFEPHKQLSTINNNEVFQTGQKFDLHAFSLKHVDHYVGNLQIRSTVLSPEAFITNELGLKYTSKLEYLRALFVFCTQHFTIVNSSYNDEPYIPNVEMIFKQRGSDTYGMAFLFKSLADAMGLNCDIVPGSLKTPQSIVKHYWNAVVINGEWRFIDVSMGNLTNPVYEILPNLPDEPNESFYFLTEPLDSIYTHIPDAFEDQHIVPPIDQMVALALPPCFPAFFKNGLKIHKFSNALTRLNDYEIFEIDLKIPKDIEVNATVQTKLSSTPTLAQVYWKHNDRFCKIKGHLSDNQHTGFVNIFSGLKGTQKSIQNVHPLSMVIPIVHEGEYRPLEFVTRYPTVPAQLNDLYIKQPQNRNLSCKGEYVFSLSQFPSMGLSTSTARTKIALQSPSGKIIKFNKKDQSTPFGLWELPVKCNEIGTWRGLVSVDNGSSLCVFAEWLCH